MPTSKENYSSTEYLKSFLPNMCDPKITLLSFTTDQIHRYFMIIQHILSSLSWSFLMDNLPDCRKIISSDYQVHAVDVSFIVLFFCCPYCGLVFIIVLSSCQERRGTFIPFNLSHSKTKHVFLRYSSYSTWTFGEIKGNVCNIHSKWSEVWE